MTTQERAGHCPHCGVKPAPRPANKTFITALLLLSTGAAAWVGGKHHASAADRPSPGGSLEGDKLSYIFSVKSDPACGVCLASADNFIKDKRLKAIAETTRNMALVPEGRYTLGAPEGLGDPDEKPRREAQLPAFYMDATEVTIQDYMAFAAATGNHYPEWLKPGGKFNLDTGKEGYYRPLTSVLKSCPSCPVIGVAQAQAEAYCRAKGKRLPTEAEWETAARGGSDAAFSFGEDPSGADPYAWNENNSGGTIHPVGQKKPNQYGLYDMHGNVWEWVSDFYAADYYAQNQNSNPAGPENGKERVIRGGSWAADADSMRSSNRASTGKPNDDIGFRCAMSAPGLAAGSGL